jgi:hypothetical protein
MLPIIEKIDKQVRPFDSLTRGSRNKHEVIIPSFHGDKVSKYKTLMMVT